MTGNAKPIVFPLGKTEQVKITEQIGKASTLLGAIPGLAWLPNVVTSVMPLLGLQSEAERQADIWKKVYDSRSFQWHRAHSMPKSELERFMGGLKKELETIIPQKQAAGDKVAPRYAAPYAFLYSEFHKIHQIRFGTTTGNVVNGVKNIAEGALGGNLGSLGKALLYGAGIFLLVKSLKLF